MSVQGPSALRIGGAALAAAGAAAAPALLFEPWSVIALPAGFVMAGIHVLLFGLPAYLLLRRRMQVDWAQAMIAGFVIGAVPLSLWSWMSDPTPQDLDFLWAVIPGLLGMLGGMTFRAIIGPPTCRTSRTETLAVFE